MGGGDGTRAIDGLLASGVMEAHCSLISEFLSASVCIPNPTETGLGAKGGDGGD